MNKLYTLVFILLNGLLSAQVVPSKTSSTTSYNSYFQTAYQQNPSIPKGILEAVAYSMTHIRHITTNEPASCIGIPRVYGVMGLTLDGQNYFHNNLNLVSMLSGTSPSDIINSPEQNILAYAKAYSIILDQKQIKSLKVEFQIPVLVALSELPDSGLQNNFALNSQLYSILTFLNDVSQQNRYGFPNQNVDLESVFGATNLQILSATSVSLASNTITNNAGAKFNPVNHTLSPDYASALWDPTPTCNYSSRSGTAISAITIHTIQGTYAGAISWAKNCSSSVSYHYVVRSSDGQVTQMVYETDKAWHVGSENPYTIGYEHDGYIDDPSWYTLALFTASAGISRDVCNSGYGISPLRTYWGPSCTGGSSVCQLGSCVKIKGHQHFPSQTHTDPGQYWDWALYYKLINNNTAITTISTATGTLYDSGGATGNYADD